MLSSESLKKGNIFLFPDYCFENTGEIRNKYGIVLSDNKTFYAILICFTTSKVDKYKDKLLPISYVFIPAGVSCFPKDTLILINDTNIHRIERDAFVDFSPKYIGELDGEILAELFSKLKNSSEISDFYKGLLK